MKTFWKMIVLLFFLILLTQTIIRNQTKIYRSTSRHHFQETCEHMKKTTTNIVVLIGIILTVHLLYTMWIIPEVNHLQIMAKSTGDLLPRNFFIIVKDIEQEIAIILFLWGLY